MVNSLISPVLGSHVTISYLNHRLVIQEFSGVCSNVKWAGKGSTFEITGYDMQFILKFHLFSPLLIDVDFWTERPTRMRKRK